MIHCRIIIILIMCDDDDDDVDACLRMEQLEARRGPTVP